MSYSLFSELFLKINFIICVLKCMHTPTHTYQCLKRQEEDVGSHAAGVTGARELLGTECPL